MTLYPFDGVLNSNEIYGAIYNMIISQQVFASPIKGVYGGLAERFKTDGTLYGDTKLFYSTQIGEVVDWDTSDQMQNEASNLLSLKRAPSPACQAVTIDVFKMVWLTVDNFLSKRAWGTEGAFSQFNSVILATIRDTKRVYEATMMNAFVGTHTAEGAGQTVAIDIPVTSGAMESDDAQYAVSDTESLNRLEAQTIATAVADLLVKIEDVSTDFNDLGYLRSYDKGDLVFVWNSDFYNKITKLDLPTIFHDEALVASLGENVLPARYFGDISNATSSVEGARLVKDKKIGETYYRAGDVIPAGTTVTAGETYLPNNKIICKILHKDSIQYMSAFETQTEFYNPRSLTNTHYLIFGHSDLAKSVLKEFPFITVEEA